jgi:hypothetical protein
LTNEYCVYSLIVPIEKAFFIGRLERADLF